MANIFDNLKRQVFDTTTRTMGYDAEWVPVDTPEVEPFKARVHYKNPSEGHELSGTNYVPLFPFIEYRAPFFPGLYESVQQRNGGEVITLVGIGVFTVKMVEAKHDGETYKAMIEPAD